jgi:hypothetical protein
MFREAALMREGCASGFHFRHRTSPPRYQALPKPSFLFSNFSPTQFFWVQTSSYNAFSYVMEKRKATHGRPRVKGLSVDKASKTTTDPPEASMPWEKWENQRAFEPFSRPAQPTRERRRRSDSSREFYTHENGNIVASVGQGKERSDRGTQKSSVGQVKERLDRGAKKSSVSQAKEGLDRGAKKSNVSQAKGESDREPGKSRLYDGAEKVVSQESSVGLSRVEVRQEREDLPLSANSTGAAQVNENRVSSSSNEMREGFKIFSQAQNSPSTPPTLDDIDRWTSHIDMQRFGESLQVAVNAVFPNETKSRYKRVSVLMLSWADEDPRLPVSMEIDKLAAVLEDTYHFYVEGGRSRIRIVILRWRRRLWGLLRR